MLALALAVLLQGQDAEAVVGPPRPHVYRWRDRAGKVYVTTTVPPPSATVLETHAHKEPAEVEDIPFIPPPMPEDIRAKMEVPLSEKTVQYWRGIEQALQEARQGGQSGEAEAIMDMILANAMFGGSLWLMPIFPVATIVLFLLLAVWFSYGLPAKTKLMIWPAFAVAGLLSAHLGAQRVVYLPQARRVGFALSMVPNYMGNHAHVDQEFAISAQGHAAELVDAASAMSLPWSFPLELYKTRKTLHLAAAEVEGSE